MRSRGACSPRLRCSTSMRPPGSPRGCASSRSRRAARSRETSSGSVLAHSVSPFLCRRRQRRRMGNNQGIGRRLVNAVTYRVRSSSPPRPGCVAPRQAQQSQALALRREDPDAARPQTVEVARHVDLESVDRGPQPGASSIVVEHLAVAPNSRWRRPLLPHEKYDPCDRGIPVADVTGKRSSARRRARSGLPARRSRTAPAAVTRREHAAELELLSPDRRNTSGSPNGVREIELSVPSG